MTSGSEITVRSGEAEDIEGIKWLADTHKHELGFLRRPALLEAIQRKELLVAQNGTNLIGFVEYRHRRDLQTTLYNIVVHPNYRNQGMGRSLVAALERDALQKGKTLIVLKCPEDLSANFFYERIGFSKVNVEPGKSRRLNIWQKNLVV